MPFINTKTNFKLTKENKDNLKAKLGKAITIIPGKKEASLMLGFENADMYFKGQEFDKLVFSEVKLFGKADRTAMEKLTAEMCKIFEEELGVPQDMTYIKYEEVEVWGHNGKNL